MFTARRLIPAGGFFCIRFLSDQSSMHRSIRTLSIFTKEDGYDAISIKAIAKFSFTAALSLGLAEPTGTETPKHGGTLNFAITSKLLT